MSILKCEECGLSYEHTDTPRCFCTARSKSTLLDELTKLLKERDALEEKLALCKYDKEAMAILGDDKIDQLEKERSLYRAEALFAREWLPSPGKINMQLDNRYWHARATTKKELNQ